MDRGREPIKEICKACGEPGHCITRNGCDNMAKYQKMFDYFKDGKNKADIKDATKIYDKFQREKHQKRDYDTAIAKYRKRARAFKRDNPNFKGSYIKKLLLDEYREEVDEGAEIEIFDDVFEEDTDDEASAVEENSNGDDSSSN